MRGSCRWRRVSGCKEGIGGVQNTKLMFSFQMICHVCSYIGHVSRKADIGKWKTFLLLDEIASNGEFCTNLEIHILRRNTFSKYIFMKFEYLYSVQFGLHHLCTCRAFQQHLDDSISVQTLCYVRNTFLECKHCRAQILTLTGITSLNFYCTKYHQF